MVAPEIPLQRLYRTSARASTEPLGSLCRASTELLQSLYRASAEPLQSLCRACTEPRRSLCGASAELVQSICRASKAFAEPCQGLSRAPAEHQSLSRPSPELLLMQGRVGGVDAEGGGGFNNCASLSPEQNCTRNTVADPNCGFDVILRTVTGKPELAIDFSSLKSLILHQRGRPAGGRGGVINPAWVY